MQQRNSREMLCITVYCQQYLLANHCNCSQYEPLEAPESLERPEQKESSLALERPAGDPSSRSPRSINPQTFSRRFSNPHKLLQVICASDHGWLPSDNCNYGITGASKHSHSRVSTRRLSFVVFAERDSPDPTLHHKIPCHEILLYTTRFVVQSVLWQGLAEILVHVLWVLGGSVVYALQWLIWSTLLHEYTSLFITVNRNLFIAVTELCVWITVHALQ